MRKFIFDTYIKKSIADNITPVALYLKLRDKFVNTILLESYDYYLKQDDASIICINPISEFIINNNNQIKISRPNGIIEIYNINNNIELQSRLDTFFKSFQSRNKSSIYSGSYGYISYDCIKYFENINLINYNLDCNNIPELRLAFYSHLIIFHHFHNEISIVEHNFLEKKLTVSVDILLDIINNKNFCSFKFNTIGKTISNISDENHIKMINKGINHCFKGDVFQIVISRQFKQYFKGDEFNVYRALRRINPSPYLFFFDYGDYKLFGSSPESQLIIKDKIAYINPIAGTIERSGNKEKDIKLEKILAKDCKENSEHVMLVDLARNDLSKNSNYVKVERFKKIQYFSHVLHMVSKISGKINDNISLIKIFADTFPAGTLSGAPKYKAMELINIIEKQNRGIYGGAIGFFGIKGNVNTAIIIRSFISINNILFFQAGSGIVSQSIPNIELQEVKNKLMALFQSVKYAKNY